MISVIEWVKDKYRYLRGTQDGGGVTISNSDSTGSFKVYSSKISSSKISTSSYSASSISNIRLPEVLDNMIYYNGSYLVLSQDDEIEFYEINDDKDNKCEIQLAKNIITKFNGEKVTKDDIPKDILDEVVKGEI